MDRLLRQPEQESIPLPVLRDDLQITPAAAQTNGAPSWVIFDPPGNRYFEIGRELLDMLALWRVGTVERLIRHMRQEFGHEVSEEQVGEAIHFLISNALVRDIPGQDYRTMVEKREAGRRGWFSQMMHSYLFFRIPLVRPDRFLRATWPFVSPFFSRQAVTVYVLFALIGLYFVSRQWDQFRGTFQFMLSWQGAAFYGLSLVIVKSIHELGHAYMSVRYGLRVPTIGIAFMVLMPVLYTDTSGAWKLRSRRQRLMIDGAGIFTELALASVSTLLWVFLPDGGVRLCVFAIATTSWVTSLIVNLNPLMRFDGYYILSDTLGFQNLQTRGFDMARWRLRELLFGLGEPAPEVLSTRLRRSIIIHAWATWIYRFFLFLGIAILVYAFFIKIVGIILFAVEILWFILLPVWREVKHWWEIRSKIMVTKRTWALGGMVAVLTLAAIIPWSTRIVIPAVLVAEQEQQVFAPFPARIAQLNVREGATVSKGDILAQLEAPQLERDVKLARERADLLAKRIGRATADNEDRASLVVLTNELEQVREELDGLQRTQARMIVRAPFDGVVTDIDPELHAGLWVDARTPLAIVQNGLTVRVKGYVDEADVFRIRAGTSATFIPEMPELPSVGLTVDDVAHAASERLDEPYLALPHGGSIPIEETKQEELRPARSVYAVAMTPTTGAAAVPRKALRGVSVIAGEPRSFFSRAKRQVLKVLVREMGV